MTYAIYIPQSRAGRLDKNLTPATQVNELFTTHLWQSTVVIIGYTPTRLFMIHVDEFTRYALKRELEWLGRGTLIVASVRGPNAVLKEIFAEYGERRFKQYQLDPHITGFSVQWANEPQGNNIVRCLPYANMRYPLQLLHHPNERQFTTVDLIDKLCSIYNNFYTFKTYLIFSGNVWQVIPEEEHTPCSYHEKSDQKVRYPRKFSDKLELIYDNFEIRDLLADVNLADPKAAADTLLTKIYAACKKRGEGIARDGIKGLIHSTIHSILLHYHQYDDLAVLRSLIRALCTDFQTVCSTELHKEIHLVLSGCDKEHLPSVIEEQIARIESLPNPDSILHHCKAVLSSTLTHYKTAAHHHEVMLKTREIVKNIATINSNATQYYKKQEYESARGLFLENIVQARLVFTLSSLPLATAYYNYARCLQLLDAKEEAIKFFKLAYVILVDHFKNDGKIRKIETHIHELTGIPFTLFNIDNHETFGNASEPQLIHHCVTNQLFTVLPKWHVLIKLIVDDIKIDKPPDLELLANNLSHTRALFESLLLISQNKMYVGPEKSMPLRRIGKFKVSNQATENGINACLHLLSGALLYLNDCKMLFIKNQQSEPMIMLLSFLKQIHHKCYKLLPEKISSAHFILWANMMNISYSLGDAHVYNDQDISALAYYQACIEYTQLLIENHAGTDTSNHILLATLRIAEIEIEQGHLYLAEKIYGLLDVNQEFGIDFSAFVTLYKLAKLYGKNEKHREAINILQQSFPIVDNGLNKAYQHPCDTVILHPFPIPAEIREFSRNTIDHIQNEIEKHEKLHLEAVKQHFKAFDAQLDIHWDSHTLRIQTQLINGQMTSHLKRMRMLHPNISRQQNTIIIEKFEQCTLETLKTLLTLSGVCLPKVPPCIQSTPAAKEIIIQSDDSPPSHARSSRKESLPKVEDSKPSINENVEDQDLPKCDAEKYHFSSRFGHHSFFQCTMRGHWQPPFYSVLVGIDDSEVAHNPQLMQQITNVIQRGKIVPPKGEQGLKWVFEKNNKPYLKIKLLGTFGNIRVTPLFQETNDKGETAFAFGTCRKK